MADRKRALGIFEMALCASLWSTAGILMKLLPWNGMAVASLRSLIAGLTVLAYILLSGKKCTVTKEVVIAGVINGLVCVCFTCANKLTTSTNAIVLQFTNPIFIVLLSAVFKKKPIRRIDLVTVLVTLGGIALFFLDKLESGYILGNMVAITAGLFMAVMFMAVGALDGDARYTAVLIGQAETFLIGLPFVIMTQPRMNAVTIPAILALGVFQLGLSYILYIKASQNCEPLLCSLLGAVEPLLNPVWVMIFDGETPGLFALTGGIIVITMVTIWCAAGERRIDKAPAGKPARKARGHAGNRT